MGDKKCKIMVQQYCTFVKCFWASARANLRIAPLKTRLTLCMMNGFICLSAGSAAGGGLASVTLYKHGESSHDP